MSGYYDSRTYVDGRLVEIRCTEPPRLLGTDCGCVRYKDEYTWVLKPCVKHAAEYEKGPTP